MPDDESAVGDLFSASVEDTGVVAEAAAAAKVDVELDLDLGGDSARNGLNCLAVVALRDLGDRGDDPDRAPPALEGDTGPGDPGESFLLPRDLVIPCGQGNYLLTASGVPSLFLSALISPPRLPFFFPFFEIFCCFGACLLPFCGARPNRSGSAKRQTDYGKPARTVKQIILNPLIRAITYNV